MEAYYDHNYITVNDQRIETVEVTVQNKFLMRVPTQLEQDDLTTYHYTSFTQAVETPLGVALRYTENPDPEGRRGVIRNYFEGEDKPNSIEANNGYRLYYQGKVREGEALSIYVLRFVVDVEDGLLLGCFSCNKKDSRSWRDAILLILSSIKRLDK